MRQLYMIGKYLRWRYRNLFSERYHPFEIYVRATYEERAMTSAQSVLLGIYDLDSGPELPGNMDQRFLEYVTRPPSVPDNYPYIADRLALPGGYQPIPIHSMSKSIPDYVLRAHK